MCVFFPIEAKGYRYQQLRDDIFFLAGTDLAREKVISMILRSFLEVLPS